MIVAFLSSSGKKLLFDFRVMHPFSNSSGTQERSRMHKSSSNRIGKRRPHSDRIFLLYFESGRAWIPRNISYLRRGPIVISCNLWLDHLNYLSCQSFSFIFMYRTLYNHINTISKLCIIIVLQIVLRPVMNYKELFIRKYGHIHDTAILN